MVNQDDIQQQSPGRFINPFTDFGFKKIFGEEPNKDLLIDFLNELLRPQNYAIKDLTYKKAEHSGASDIDRRVVFDLYCENEKGEKFIVEMQKTKQTYFKDRTLFYSTFPIQEQATRGEKWDYGLKAVFAVALLDFTFDDEVKDKPIVNRVQLIDKNTWKVFYDKLTYIFVQVPNFTKTIDELETHLDKWLYVLKHMEKFDRIPEKIKDKIFQKVFNLAEYHKLSKEERKAYEDSLKYYRDLKNSLDTAKDEGKKEGKKEGYKEAEDTYKPIVEKERTEKKELQRKSARELKAAGVPIDKIVEITGLSREEIEKL